MGAMTDGYSFVFSMNDTTEADGDSFSENNGTDLPSLAHLLIEKVKAAYTDR